MSDASSKFFKILFWALGITILFVIGSNLVSIYRGSMSGVQEDESRNVACNQLYFSAEMKDEDMVILRNGQLSSENIDELTLVGLEDMDTYTENIFLFRPDTEREHDLSGTNITDEFAVFPFNCESLAYICSRESGTCSEDNE